MGGLRTAARICFARRLGWIFCHHLSLCLCFVPVRPCVSLSESSASSELEDAEDSEDAGEAGEAGEAEAAGEGREEGEGGEKRGEER